MEKLLLVCVDSGMLTMFSSVFLLQALSGKKMFFREGTAVGEAELIMFVKSKLEPTKVTAVGTAVLLKEVSLDSVRSADVLCSLSSRMSFSVSSSVRVIVWKIVTFVLSW